MRPTVGLLPVVVILAALGAGCAGEPPAPIDGGIDSAPPVEDAAPRTWEVVETLTDDGTILVEKVAYDSGGLRIYGQVCRPVGAGPYPLHIVNHGGFGGLGADWNGVGVCQDPARNGYVVIESSYRGEDGSDGAIEVCHGEVDDVLAMIDIALAQPYVDRNRVSMLGGSHGGCITTRAVQRGAPVHLAIDMMGPSDWTVLHAFWTAQRSSTTGDVQAFYGWLLDTIEAGAGGTPAEVPEAYEARSPRQHAGALAGFAGPYLRVHGVADALVPADQACLFAADAGGFAAWRVDGNLAVQTTPPAGCEGLGITWRPGPRPSTSWPESRYLLVYDTAPHGFEGPGGQAMLGDVIAFFLARRP